jgi:general secretion pathway protein L
MDRIALGGGSIATLKSLRDWWGRSLAAWLPPRWRRALGLDRGRLLLRAGEAGEAPPGAAADLPRWLLLPAGAGLRRRLTLPFAAGERLREVVGFEIDRQTPFAADAVVFDARVLGRRAGDGQLDVELVVVPRAALDAQLARLGPWVGRLAGADIEGDDGTPLGVNLLPLAQRSRHHDPARGWNFALAALALVGIALMLAQVLHNRERALRELESSVAREVAAARTVSLQRQQLVDLVEGRAYVERLRSGRPAAIEVLDELARRLPDNTWLDKLAIDNDRLLLIGRSGEASALVARLAGAKQWRSPALTGTLQPDARSGRDRFTLTADLAIATSPPAKTGAATTGGADAGRD